MFLLKHLIFTLYNSFKNIFKNSVKTCNSENCIVVYDVELNYVVLQRIKHMWHLVSTKDGKSYHYKKYQSSLFSSNLSWIIKNIHFSPLKWFCFYICDSFSYQNTLFNFIIYTLFITSFFYFINFYIHSFIQCKITCFATIIFLRYCPAV